MKIVNKHTKQIKYFAICIMLILSVTLFFSACQNSTSESNKRSWEDQRTITAEYLMSDGGNKNISSPGGEWSLIAVSTSGVDLKDNLYEDYYNNLCALTVQTRGILDKEYPTTYARAAMALSLIGKDPKDIQGYNLMAAVDDAGKVKAQGVNSAIYALMASNFCGINLENEEVYLDMIQEEMKPGGDLEDDPFAIDYYGMALQALTYYQDDPEVEKTIDYLYDKIKTLGEEKGELGNCESTAQAILGLSAIGKDASEENFLKGDKTPVDALMEYATEDGFKHTEDGETDIMASEQGLLALNSVAYVKDGKLLLDKK